MIITRLKPYPHGKTIPAASTRQTANCGTASPPPKEDRNMTPTDEDYAIYCRRAGTVGPLGDVAVTMSCDEDEPGHVSPVAQVCD